MSGLQICKNIERLNLSDNSIIRIEAVDNLPKLIYLDLSGNKISKTFGLGMCLALECLVLNNNPISRFGDMIDLCDCKSLRLGFVHFVDFFVFLNFFLIVLH